jgi:hypothetical protein
MTSSPGSSLWMVWLFGMAACGGGTTQPAPPPAPPPPPPPPIGARLQLAPGDVRVLSDAASTRAFAVEGIAAGSEYQVIVMSGSRVEGAVSPLRFEASATGAGASVVPGSRVDLSASPGRSTLGLLGTDEGPTWHTDLLAGSDEALARAGATVQKGARRAGAVPVVGEMMTFTSAFGVPAGSNPCFNGSAIAGTVMSVGARFVLVEEIAAAGYLTTSDYDAINSELHGLVDKVDEAYFGAPGDIDGNQRVIIFYNWEPNRRGVIGGAVTGQNFADAGTCPNSNEAELIWVSAADPDGTVGPAVSIAFTKDIAPGLIAHEYQHLLNATQRLVLGSGTYGDGSLEEAWLNEAMSHVAEEVAGLYEIGGEVRSNYGFAEVGAGWLPATPHPFNVFLGLNLLRAAQYLAGPAEISALDTQSQMVGSPVRGWGYLFLRWLADRYAPASPAGIVPGSGEEALFRELSTGGPTHETGVGNVLRAIQTVSGESPTWDEVLSQYFAAPAVDDANASLPDEVQFATWDFPRLFDEMQSAAVPGLEAGYPLAPVDVAVGSGASSTLTFDLGASTAQYFRLQAEAASPDMLVELTAPSGANVPSSARVRIIVVRTR